MKVFLLTIKGTEVFQNSDGDFCHPKFTIFNAVYNDRSKAETEFDEWKEVRAKMEEEAQAELAKTDEADHDYHRLAYEIGEKYNRDGITSSYNSWWDRSGRDFFFELEADVEEMEVL